jgi:hypothetical protein
MYWSRDQRYISQRTNSNPMLIPPPNFEPPQESALLQDLILESPITLLNLHLCPLGSNLELYLNVNYNQ